MKLTKENVKQVASIIHKRTQKLDESLGLLRDMRCEYQDYLDGRGQISDRRGVCVRLLAELGELDFFPSFVCNGSPLRTSGCILDVSGSLEHHISKESQYSRFRNNTLDEHADKLYAKERLALIHSTLEYVTEYRKSIVINGIDCGDDLETKTLLYGLFLISQLEHKKEQYQNYLDGELPYHELDRRGVCVTLDLGYFHFPSIQFHSCVFDSPINRTHPLSVIPFISNLMQYRWFCDDDMREIPLFSKAYARKRLQLIDTVIEYFYCIAEEEFGCVRTENKG